MAGIRHAVATRSFDAFYEQAKDGWARGDIPPR